MKKFPKIFTDPNFEYDKKLTKEDKYKVAVADGLEGWALIMNGVTSTSVFGIGMVKIGDIIEEAPLPEVFKELAKEINENA